MTEINREEILNQIKKSGTLEKQLKEVQDRIFQIDMVDRWTEEDSACWNFYKDLEKDIKRKIEEGEQNEQDSISDTTL